jgi:hypothetical protein
VSPARRARTANASRPTYSATNFERGRGIGSGASGGTLHQALSVVVIMVDTTNGLESRRPPALTTKHAPSACSCGSGPRIPSDNHMIEIAQEAALSEVSSIAVPASTSTVSGGSSLGDWGRAERRWRYFRRYLRRAIVTKTEASSIATTPWITSRAR